MSATIQAKSHKPAAAHKVGAAIMRKARKDAAAPAAPIDPWNPATAPAGAKPVVLTAPSSLASRAMLVSLNIRQWAGTKQDKKITSEVHRDHNIDEAVDAGRFNKKLLGKDALKSIQRIVGFARNTHIALTLPWTQEGQRILSVHGYQNYMEKIRGYRKEFEAELPNFVAQFPQYVAQRAIELNGAFNPADYPDASKIASHFTFTLRISPLPIGNDFRADLDDVQKEEIRREIEAQTSEAIDGTVRFMHEKLAKMLSHMVESLKDYKPSEKLGDGRETKPKGIFRNSLVENIREVVSLMPSFNITNSPELAAITERIKADLCEFDAEDLRESDGIRQKTAEKAEKILADITGFLA